eukprot:1700172-Rhodomonas_salina.1
MLAAGGIARDSEDSLSQHRLSHHMSAMPPTIEMARTLRIARPLTQSPSRSLALGFSGVIPDVILLMQFRRLDL